MVFMHSYNITPQTGNLSDRSPNSWELKGWNGSSWVTIDARNNIPESYWVSQASRDFNIQNPGRYQKYKLLIKAVNGSTVVSLRSFKLYGEKISYNKSAILSSQTAIENDFSQDYSIDFDIFPNPTSNGEFELSSKIIINSNIETIDDTSSIDLFINGDINEVDNKVIIDIFNLEGKIVYSSTLKYKKKVSINTGLKSGIYFVQLKTGREQISKKLIVN
jgi:hypothetical protein